MNKVKVISVFLVAILSACIPSEEEFMKHHASGLADAKTIDQAVCLEKSIVKTRNCTSMKCSVNVSAYFHACFKSAEKSPTVCEGVPVWSGVFKDAKWREDQCIANSADPIHCDIIFSSLQEECH